MSFPWDFCKLGAPRQSLKYPGGRQKSRARGCLPGQAAILEEAEPNIVGLSKGQAPKKRDPKCIFET